jgi:hypothetical protein
MFAPMTAQTEYARFEAENAELQRRAATLMQVQWTPGISLLDRFINQFTAWALRRREPLSPVKVPESPVSRAPECC